MDEVPINQEDMAGTNLAFSYVILSGLERLGFAVDHQSKEAFLHIWNVIGYGLGVDDRLLPMNMKEAYWLERKIRERQFASSFEGKELTRLLLEHYKVTIPDKRLKGLVTPQVQYLVGEEVGDLLDIRTSTFDKWILRGFISVQRFKNIFLPHHPTFEDAMTAFEELKSS
jgi:hypothetical protein